MVCTYTYYKAHISETNLLSEIHIDRIKSTHANRHTDKMTLMDTHTCTAQTNKKIEHVQTMPREYLIHVRPLPRYDKVSASHWNGGGIDVKSFDWCNSNRMLLVQLRTTWFWNFFNKKGYFEVICWESVADCFYTMTSWEEKLIHRISAQWCL